MEKVRRSGPCRGAAAKDEERGCGRHDSRQDDDLRHPHRGEDAVNGITYPERDISHQRNGKHRLGDARPQEQEHAAGKAAENPDCEGKCHPCGIACHDRRLTGGQAGRDEALFSCRDGS